MGARRHGRGAGGVRPRARLRRACGAVVQSGCPGLASAVSPRRHATSSAVVRSARRVASRALPDAHAGMGRARGRARGPVRSGARAAGAEAAAPDARRCPGRRGHGPDRRRPRHGLHRVARRRRGTRARREGRPPGAGSERALRRAVGGLRRTGPRATRRTVRRWDRGVAGRHAGLAHEGRRARGARALQWGDRRAPRR